jgi:hypothetical protein
MKNVPSLTLAEFVDRYCSRQVCNPDDLKEILRRQKETFAPKGWLLLECADLSSSRLGDLVILPYGGETNTFKEIPDRPISPRGLASDMSTVAAILPASEVDG